MHLLSHGCDREVTKPLKSWSRNPLVFSVRPSLANTHWTDSQISIGESWICRGKSYFLTTVTHKPAAQSLNKHARHLKKLMIQVITLCNFLRGLKSNSTSVYPWTIFIAISLFVEACLIKKKHEIEGVGLKFSHHEDGNYDWYSLISSFKVYVRHKLTNSSFYKWAVSSEKGLEDIFCPFLVLSFFAQVLHSPNNMMEVIKVRK